MVEWEQMEAIAFFDASDVFRSTCDDVITYTQLTARHRNPSTHGCCELHVVGLLRRLLDSNLIWVCKLYPEGVNT